MVAGLFGKLPSKRDFVAVNAPGGFSRFGSPGYRLASRRRSKCWARIGPTSTIARRSGATGSVRIFAARRPSASSCRRSTALADLSRSPFSPAKGALPPPELEPNDEWCEAAEAILLDALDPAATLETVADKIASMPLPALPPRSGDVPGFQELPEGGVVVRGIDRQISQAFLAARRLGYRRAFASQSFWWTIGGEGFPPLALSQVGLPTPIRFVDMLTGAFAESQMAVPSEGT